ncbi:hypothetical protein [Azospirillum brasilense]|uniref:hypothetical protein n=1 Tax=Azospirillum brasilense TaxID=192 RepID=UPI0013B3FD44|nr:hypothetical protein [Azospirillum brasilense]
MLLKKEVRVGHGIERMAATLSALAIVGTAMGLLIRNEPIADPRLFFALRVIVSVAAAVLGATIPGFLQVRWSRGGLAVRAGGALALFVLTFVYTPDLVTAQGAGPATVIQSSSGKFSPPIIGNSGSITIQGGKR